MTATPRSLVLRMDEGPAQTRERIDRVRERILGVRARTRVLSDHIAELARQFLDDELIEPAGSESGPERGQPMARQGRIEWLGRLAGLHRSYCSACDEELQLQALLRRLQDSAERRSAPEGFARAGAQRDVPASR